MGIKIFIYVLFTISVISYYYQVDVDLENENKEERPLVTFDSATMYTIDEYEVKRIVQAKIAAFFEKKEEMYDAVIVDRIKDKTIAATTDTMRTNYLLKEGQFLTMRGDVKYNRGSLISLTSEELFYDMDKMIGYNYKPFELVYNGQQLKGSNIYFDAKKNTFEADKANFKLDEIVNKDNNETK